MCYHKASSPLPVPMPGTCVGDLFEVAAHRDCPFHPMYFNRFVTVALIVGLLRSAVSRYAVPLQSGLSSDTKLYQLCSAHLCRDTLSWILWFSMKITKKHTFLLATYTLFFIKYDIKEKKNLKK